MKIFDWLASFFNSDVPTIWKIIIVCIIFLVANLIVIAIVILLLCGKPSSEHNCSNDDVTSHDVSPPYVETEIETTTTTISKKIIKKTTKGPQKCRQSTTSDLPKTNSKGKNNGK